MGGKCDLFDAEPFEHASFCINSWDKRGDKSPVLVSLLYDIVTRSFSRSSYFLRSLYLDMIQIRIFKSYSPQLRLIRLVLSILCYQLLTFLFLSLFFSLEIRALCNFLLFFLLFFEFHSKNWCLSVSVYALICRFLQETLWNVL